MITNPSARLSCGSIRSACSHVNFIPPSSHRTRRGGRGRLQICNLFTGIVQGKAEVRQVDRKDGFSSVRIAFPEDAVEGLQTGASVAINGTCLTATSISGDEVGFDIISETLRATNLGGLEEGSKVNYERSARMGAEIGGHNVSGHVHTTAEVVEVQDTENNRRLAFQLREPKWIKYVLPKGFIAVDGCSLTVGEVWNTGFSVYLIPETLRVTTLGDKSKPGSTVNLEIETQTQIIVDTVERVVEQYMAAQAAAT